MIIEYMGLGAAVNQALKDTKFPMSFLKESLAVPMGLSPTTIPEYVHWYSKGMPYGTRTSNPQNPDARLERLAIFLYALGFPEENEMQGNLIAGLRGIVIQNGHQFEYPPPEDKRVSYENLKRIYLSQNNAVEGGSAEEKNGIQEETIEQQIGIKESVADRVNRLLTMPISEKPDNEQPYENIRAREVYIESVTYGHKDFELNDFGVYVTIKVTPQQSATGEALHSDTYRIHYKGNLYGKGVGVRTGKALKEFLSDIRGQKARIIYYQDRHTKGGQIITIVQMIAPVESEIIYFRDGRILKPYNLRENKFIGV